MQCGACSKTIPSGIECECGWSDIPDPYDLPYAQGLRDDGRVGLSRKDEEMRVRERFELAREFLGTVYGHIPPSNEVRTLINMLKAEHARGAEEGAAIAAGIIALGEWARRTHDRWQRERDLEDRMLEADMG